jgi:hypothetical protein
MDVVMTRGLRTWHARIWRTLAPMLALAVAAILWLTRGGQ